MPNLTSAATAAVFFAVATSGASAESIDRWLMSATSVAGMARLVTQDIDGRVFENDGRQQNRRVEIVIKP